MSKPSLRDQLRSLRRNVGTDRAIFIPQKLLYRLLSRDVVSSVLRQSHIPATHIDSLTDRVLKGGQKLFAILVLLKGDEDKIVHFVKHDQFTTSSLDSKLPFSHEALTAIAPEIAAEFYETQWEVLAPVFTKGVLHRELHDMIRLPFIGNKMIGRGGFGDVHEIELDQHHQVLPFTAKEDKLRAVRKEFRSETDDEEDWRRELYNLSLLNELKHPNIIETLGSYTHCRRHNLLFRLAPHGDLSTFFEKPRPEGFESDDSFFYALSQLGSAICAVHNFTSKTLDLRFIGCHHDLKPKNILFDGKRFILADFGLSRFRDSTESSKGLFEVGQGYHLAPECEDLHDNFKKHIVSRPSDIWSFGCIIAEILTYMQLGPGSISEFKAARAIKIGESKTYTFHAGRFKANPGVDTWLSKLRNDMERTHGLTHQLIRSMLALDPESRPSASEVSFRLSFIALTAYVGTVGENFSTLLFHTDSIEANIEQERFRVWNILFESVITAEDSQYSVAEDPMAELDPVLRILIECKEELSSMLERYKITTSPIYGELRDLINQLHNFLPPELRKLARSRVEENLMMSEDLAVLESMSALCGEHAATERISMLLTIKRMSILAFQNEKRTRPDLYIDDANQIELETATPTRYLGEHCLAKFQQHNLGPQRRVIVEWIRYTAAWEESVSETLMARVEAIASLLNNPKKPTSRVLSCSGYYHDPNRPAFGVIYEFPDRPLSNLPIIPRTLSDVINSTTDTRGRPCLEDRYLLAYQLATSIIDCHNVGWMHKNVSAHNVVFFHSHGSHSSSWIQNPYIVGFNHSRPDDHEAFTLGPGTARFKEYQHPSYHEGHRFVREFDFYSLGIVLLEIGLWTTLQTLTARWKHVSLEDLRSSLLLKRVPLLAHSMGNGYHNAVEACLSYTLGTSAPALTTMKFEESLGSRVLAGVGKYIYKAV